MPMPLKAVASWVIRIDDQYIVPETISSWAGSPETGWDYVAIFGKFFHVDRVKIVDGLNIVGSRCSMFIPNKIGAPTKCPSCAYQDNGLCFGIDVLAPELSDAFYCG